MSEKKALHYALIPAKKESSRCPNKNWRNFINGYSLVDFTLKTIPNGFFRKIIISTDNDDYVSTSVDVHHRDKSLATKDSCIKTLMHVIIKDYDLDNDGYLWTLNPTSPFRLEEDYRRILKNIEKMKPDAVVSGFRIHPFIWKDSMPLFETKGKRRNTQDFSEEYVVENGMFYVVNIGYFRKTDTWYCDNTKLYVQNTVCAHVDIDTKNDFKDAQKIAEIWNNN